MSDHKPMAQKLALMILGAMVFAGVVIAFINADGLKVGPTGERHYSAASDAHENVPTVDVAAVTVVPPIGLSLGLNYSLETVAKGNAVVPRIFLSSVPAELASVKETALKKRLFFKTVLPLILQANQDILQDREKLLALRDKQVAGVAFSGTERLWLTVMAERYRLESPDIAKLAHRVDIVPPSMALAQAAKESGWGTSRFAREGNALFGQWTWEKGESGLVPDARIEGKTHRVRAFEDLLGSVKAYIQNLNNHNAYREFRSQRAALRSRGKPMQGVALVGTLHRYSELGTEYTDRLKTMIQSNDLSRLDDAELAAHDIPEN